MSSLHVAHPRVRLVIFGEGFLNNQLRAQAASLGLGDVVQFVGYREDLDAFIGCFDLFVHPASVSDGETGFLVPPDDAEALGDAIGRLIDDEPLRASLGAAGRERMQNDFAIATMVSAHLALYESLLAE